MEIIKKAAAAGSTTLCININGDHGRWWTDLWLREVGGAHVCYFIKFSQWSWELGTRTKFIFWMGKPRPEEPKSFTPTK